MLRRKIALALLIFTGAFQMATVRADVRSSTIQDLHRLDIVAHALAVEPVFWLGLLRLQITLKEGTPPSGPWGLSLLGDNSEEISLNSENAATRIIRTSDDAILLIDIPVPAWSTLQVTTNGPIASVAAISVSYPSAARAQQMIPDSQVDYFDDGVGPAEKALALAFGRLDIRSDNNVAQARICTAFRVKKGYWLTAAHCVTRDPKGSPNAATFSIQPSNYAGKTDPVSQLSAAVVATGQHSGDWNPGNALEPDELDFALLKVATDPGGPAFPLVPAQESKDDVLQLLMHWSQMPPGKARSAGKSCTLDRLIGTNQMSQVELCYMAIRHGCSSDDGASGAPLVRRQAPQHLVGMNYRAGLTSEFNCAIPVAPIQTFLCNVKPQLATEVTQCPGH